MILDGVAVLPGSPVAFAAFDVLTERGDVFRCVRGERVEILNACRVTNEKMNTVHDGTPKTVMVALSIVAMVVKR